MPVKYFLPNQIVLHVGHPAGLSRDDIAARVANSPDLRDLVAPGAGLPLAIGQVTTFEPIDGEIGFSVIPLTLDRAVDVPFLLNSIFGATHGDPLSFHDSAAPDPNEVGTLLSVAPNWLMHAAQHQIGIGGPGSVAEQAPAPAGNEWKFSIQPASAPDNASVDVNPSAGLYVAILDTAPSQAQIDAAFARPEWKNHRLLRRLLGKSAQASAKEGKSTLFIDRNFPLGLPIADFCLRRHRYKMSDHGLFIAGIINTIAPRASLHLYEVLGEYGVGSLETIAAGFRKALEWQNQVQISDPAGRVIVNCSFMMSMPRAGHGMPDYPELLVDGDAFVLGQKVQYFSQSLLAICDLLEKYGLTIVAAAGNDSPRLTTAAKQVNRPAARFPAAFGSVIGVGAMPKEAPTQNGKYLATSYSNVSDEVETDGYLTLGGESGADRGIRGIYLGKFLTSDRDGNAELAQYSKNRTGWAWWAGTSFATPIVSGYLAKQALPAPALGQQPTGPARQVLGAAAAVAQSSRNERVILATQP